MCIIEVDGLIILTTSSAHYFQIMLSSSACFCPIAGSHVVKKQYVMYLNHVIQQDTFPM